MTDVRHEHAPQRWETNRVEAFSDGVFAIAISLLVLEIKSPRRTSTISVAPWWTSGRPTSLRFIDPVMLRINLLLLMAAAFLPFPTAVLAQAFHASDAAERTAVAFYGLTALVIELLLRAGIRYAASQPDLALAQPMEQPAPAPPAERGWVRR